MPFAVRIHAFGGPEVLRYEEVGLGEPGPGEVRIRHRACGVNFVDTYFRSGLYPRDLPLVLGNEAAGEIVAVGPGVADLQIGDRVAFSHDLGGYATERLMPADRVVPVPGAVSDEVAAAVLLKGTTAYYLLHETFAVEPGMTILVHAAAGGVGSLLCQWAAALGAQVIGTVGSPDKVALAQANGCRHVILSREEDVPARVREVTEGRLCDVVYDGIGRDAYPASLDCLRPRGLLASFGNASGPIASLEVGLLARKGSLYVTRPTGGHYLATRAALTAAADAVFRALAAGTLSVRIDRRYPLAEAASAHRDLESRATQGALVLIPD